MHRQRYRRRGTMGAVKPSRRIRISPGPVAAGQDLPSTEAEELVDLLARSSRGDEEAFSRLYDRLAGFLYGIVRKVVRDPTQSQEVAQEVFLEIWRLAPHFDRTKGSVKTWAAVIAHRRAVDRVRSEQSTKNREDRESRLTPIAADVVADEVAGRFERDQVRGALAVLSAVQRQAVELAYYGGYTYREVAVLLETPEGTIKTRIRDGLIRLRQELGVVA